MNATATEIPKMHAHRCEHCAVAGKLVYWIHPDTCKGSIQAHTCPECGSVEWRQALVEPGRLPQGPQVHNAQNFETILGYILLIAGLAVLGYAAFVYVKDLRSKKALPL